MTGEEGVSTLDARDPNYDSDEERQVVYHQSHANAIRAEVQAYKQEVRRQHPPAPMRGCSCSRCIHMPCLLVELVCISTSGLL